MIPGICDRCGTEYPLKDLLFEWTGHRVCHKCRDKRHPQEFVRGVPDQQFVRGALPEPAPVYLLTDLILQESGDLFVLEADTGETLDRGFLALEP